MATIAEILQTMEYGPAPETDVHVRAWLSAHAGRFTHFIDGAFRASPGGESFEVRDPAHDTLLAHVAQGTADDIGVAVAAARAAHPGWSALPGHARARYLYAIARHVQKHERFLAVLESMDNGKPIRESRDIDIPLVVRHFYHHAGWAQLAGMEFAGYRSVGVCGQIVPWNFPLLMLAWKIAPALAAGNTVVLKPAEYTPLSALAFAEICREINLPPGVVNIVCGDGTTGAALVEHPDVDKIAFTGSTDIGRAIRMRTAGSGKRLSLELGGKSPFIVYDDADLDSAVEGVVDAIWFNQGEVCCAGSRLLVQESIAPTFYPKLKRRMEALRVGEPLDKSTDIGAIVAPIQLRRIRDLIDEGRREGGTVWQPSQPLPQAGWFYPPTLVTDVAPASTLAQVEIFGPVAVALTFRTPDEAVALANNTRYGLAASVWSENISVALDTAARIKAGVVWINATNLFDAGAAFGGYKESGFGREGGRAGLAEYLTTAAADDVVPSDEPAGAVLSVVPAEFAAVAETALPDVDRTAKLFIGGKQVRPDAGYTYAVCDVAGTPVGQAGLGNRKDIRNAVEAAVAATAWSSVAAHNRAQVLYYIAENLAARAAEFARRIPLLTGTTADAAAHEVAVAVERTFWYAAWADKFDGRVHATRARHITLAMHEPWGVVGIVCPDEAPLLAFVSLVMPALAMGNRVVVVPAARGALVATDFAGLIESSDVPAGAINIVTGDPDALAGVLSDHDDVAAVWYHGSATGSARVERASAGNLKNTWVTRGQRRDWLTSRGQSREFLERATQIKTIWVPYGM